MRSDRNFAGHFEVRTTMQDRVSEFLDEEIARIHKRKHQTPSPTEKTEARADLAAFRSRLKQSTRKQEKSVVK